MTEAKNPLRNILKSEFPYKGHIIDVRVDTVKFPVGRKKSCAKSCCTARPSRCSPRTPTAEYSS